MTEKSNMQCFWIWCFLAFIMFPCLWSQPERSLYIETDAEMQQEMEYALAQEVQGQLSAAWTIYQRHWKKSKALVQPCLLSHTALQSLKTAIDQYKSNSTVTSPVVFPELILNPTMLAQVAALESKAGFGATAHYLNKALAPGLYISTPEYIRIRCGHWDKELSEYASLKREMDEQIQAAWNIGPQQLYRVILQYPLQLISVKLMIDLGDWYFEQGQLHRALGIWYRLKLWKQNLSTQDCLDVDIRIALASYLCGDFLVFQALRDQYQTALYKETWITYRNQKMRLSRFFQEIAKEKYSQTTQQWNCFGGNPSQSRLITGPDLVGKDFPCQAFRLSRHYDFHEIPRPLFGEKRIYTYSLSIKDHFIVATSIQNPDEPKTLWRFSFPLHIAMDMTDSSLYSPALWRDRLYVLFPPNTLGNQVFCLDTKETIANSQRVIWKWPTESEAQDIILHSAPLVLDGKVFLHLTLFNQQINSEIVCLNAQTGELIWRQFLSSIMPLEYKQATKLKYAPASTGLAAGYGLVYCCSNLGTIGAVDMETGEIRWISKYHELLPQQYRLQLGKTIPKCMHTPPIVKHGKLYVVAQDAKLLLVYHALTGAIQQIFPDSQHQGEFQELFGVSEDGKIFLCTQDEILALQPNAAQEILWCKGGFSGSIGHGMLTREWLYFAASGNLFQMSIENGKCSRIENPNLGVLSNTQGLLLISDISQDYLIRTGRQLYIHKITPPNK